VRSAPKCRIWIPSGPSTASARSWKRWWARASRKPRRPQQPFQPLALGGLERGRELALRALHARQHLGHRAASRVGRHEHVGPAILRIAPALDQPAGLERVDQLDHHGAVDVEALGELLLRQRAGRGQRREDGRIPRVRGRVEAARRDAGRAQVRGPEQVAGEVLHVAQRLYAPNHMVR
jgi:hypothetical protein